MDFDDTPEEIALRAQARAWLDANAEPLDRDSITEMRTYRAHTEEQDAALLDEARDWQRQKAEAGWAAPSWPAEFGGRGLSPMLAGVFAAEEGAYDVAGRLFSVGTDMVGPTVIEWGTARAALVLPAPHPAGGRHLVPAVQRTRRRVGPGRTVHQGGPGRRRVDHHRPEGVDLRRALRRQGHPAGPHGPRRAQAPGYHGHRRRHARARCRRPALAPDRRRHPLQRGVPDRGPRAGGRHARAGRQRLGRGAVHAHQRTGLHRGRHHVQLRAGGQPGPGDGSHRREDHPPTPRRPLHPGPAAPVPRIPGAHGGRARARCPDRRARS